MLFQQLVQLLNKECHKLWSSIQNYIVGKAMEISDIELSDIVQKEPYSILHDNSNVSRDKVSSLEN